MKRSEINAALAWAKDLLAKNNIRLPDFAYWTMDEWKATIYNSRHKLYPVCGESADDVLGILNAKDYFRL